MYVGGNGGFQPAHAQLLASDLDDETLIRYIDRYMMYYIRTADRLQRTARWMEDLDGGLDHVRDVVVERLARPRRRTRGGHGRARRRLRGRVGGDPGRPRAAAPVPHLRQRAGRRRTRAIPRVDGTRPVATRDRRSELEPASACCSPARAFRSEEE